MFNIKRPLWDLKPLICGGVSLLLLSFALVIQTFQGSKPLAAAQTTCDGRIAGGSIVVAGGGFVTTEIRQRFFELAGDRRPESWSSRRQTPPLGPRRVGLLPGEKSVRRTWNYAMRLTGRLRIPPSFVWHCVRRRAFGSAAGIRTFWRNGTSIPPFRSACRMSCVETESSGDVRLVPQFFHGS